MSGLSESLLADWLTKADERSYQTPFASALARRGERILYYSSHSSLELGKDIVTEVPGMGLVAYQLKAGDINLRTYREIRGEIHDAVLIPFESPGKRRRLPDKVVLVASGHLSDTARQAFLLEFSGTRCPVDLIEFEGLLEMFRDTFDRLIPPSLPEVSTLLRLYLVPGGGLPDIGEVAHLFDSTLELGRAKSLTAWNRRASDVTMAAAVAAAPYETVDNRCSALLVWVAAATAILKHGRASNRTHKQIASALEIPKQAVSDLGERYIRELIDPGALGIHGPVDALVNGPRTLLLLGIGAAVLNMRRMMNSHGDSELSEFMATLDAAGPLRVWGEGSWNFIFQIAQLRRAVSPTRAEDLVASWLDRISDKQFSDPYVGPESSIELSRKQATTQSDLARPPALARYSLASAIQYLVRHMRRQTLAARWRTVSRIDSLSIEAREPWGLLEWRCEDGTVEQRQLPARASWRALREAAVPDRAGLFEGCEWLLPVFLIAFPHRIDAGLCALLDRLCTRSMVEA